MRELHRNPSPVPTSRDLEFGDLRAPMERPTTAQATRSCEISRHLASNPPDLPTATHWGKFATSGCPTFSSSLPWQFPPTSGLCANEYRHPARWRVDVRRNTVLTKSPA